ncbi:MAG: 50S ribosomal protein L16 [Thermoplasmata archaeon]|nr:MAG: 50S ribosomal protein L16 [Thermoplasmata archaeon]
MARKPNRMYRDIKGQPTTRKEYLKGVPNPKITQFDMGNRKESFPFKISLLVEEACHIRHNALDAARVAANRFMEKSAGVANYHLKVRVYPHVILRENKQATGAGADRVSQGMRKAYGKPVGTAARVRPNQPIITIETKQQFVEKAKEALRRAGMKIPSPFKIVIEGQAQ